MIIAAGIRVYVENLAGEKQVFDLFGAHRLRVHLADVDAASRNDGLGDRAGRRDGQREGLQQRQQRPPLLPRDLVDLFARFYACQSDEGRDELLRQQRAERVDEIAVCVFGEIAQQAAVKRVGGQGGLEVDIEVTGITPAQIGRGGENHRPRNAEMREQHLPRFAVQLAPVAGSEGQPDVFQRQSHAGAAEAARRVQRHKRGLRRHDCMASRARPGVSVAGRAGLGIRKPAGGNNNTVAADGLSVHAQAGDGAVFDDESLHGGADEFHARTAAGGHEEIGHIRGAVALREHAAAALGFGRQPALLEQRDHRLRRQRVQRGVKELGVGDDVFQKRRYIAVVRDVAAALAGDVQLAAGRAVLFKHRDRLARLRGGKRRHQPGGARADDGFIYPCHKYCIFPRCPPAANRYWRPRADASARRR